MSEASEKLLKVYEDLHDWLSEEVVEAAPGPLLPKDKHEELVRRLEEALQAGGRAGRLPGQESGEPVLYRYTFAEVSTNHITREDLQRLEDGEIPYCAGAAEGDTGGGYMWVPFETPESARKAGSKVTAEDIGEENRQNEALLREFGVSEAFIRILKLAASQGAVLVRFSMYTCETEGLETFEKPDTINGD